MLLRGQRLPLRGQQAQRPDDLAAGLVRGDDRVDVPALGGDVRVGQGLLVLVDQLRSDGAALALGGIFLVRFAWEQGYFGPLARTIAATRAWCSRFSSPSSSCCHSTNEVTAAMHLSTNSEGA